MILDSVTTLLELCSQRDSVMRLVYYSSHLIAGLVYSTSTASKLNIIASQISNSRTVLRLFDDLPMLHCFIKNGFRRKERNRVLAACAILKDVCDQLYYPLEHTAWAADNQLIGVASDSWWTACTVCWALSLSFSLIRVLLSLSLLQRHVKCSNRREQNESETQQYPDQLSLTLSAVGLLAELVEAVHWLPKGFLWSGRLKQWHIGVLGIVSSAITLYQAT